MGLITGIAAAASLAGGAISSSKANKAAKYAADQSLQVAQENNALAREFYGKNEGYLKPAIQRGETAGQYLNAFLGLPGPPQPAAPASNALAQGLQYGQVGMVDIPGIGSVQIPGGTGANWQAALGGQVPQPAGTTAVPAGGALAQGVTQGNAQDAFRSFLDTSDFAYQSALGRDAVNSYASGGGWLQSGAALQELQDRQNNINTGYRGEYLGYLGNQQGVGLSAGSALAGVGQNFVNTIGANNRNAADAASNARLYASNNNFGNTLATLGGTILGSRL